MPIDPKINSPFVNADQAQSPSAQQGRGFFFWLRIIAVLYAAFILYASWLPFDFRPVLAEKQLKEFIQTPLARPNISTTDWSANVLLAMPLGALGMGAFEGKTPAKPGVRFALLLLVLLFATTMSLLAELGQTMLPDRVPSKLDVVGQAVGALCGTMGWLVLRSRILRWLEGFAWSSTRRDLAIRILIGYAAACGVYQLLPLTPTLDIGLLWLKVKNGLINIIPFADLPNYSHYAVISKVAIIVPVGYLAHLICRHPDATPRRAMAVVLILGYVGLLELGQVFVLYRHATTTDLVWGLVGGVLGMVLASRYGPGAEPDKTEENRTKRPGLAPLVLCIALMAYIAWQKLFPFDFAFGNAGQTDPIHALTRLPFLALLRSEPLSSISTAFRTIGASAVLAMVYRGCGLGKGASIALLTVWFLLLETAQLALPGRVADLSMLLVSVAAGWAGTVVYPHLHRIFLAKPKSLQDLDRPSPSEQRAKAGSGVR